MTVRIRRKREEEGWLSYLKAPSGQHGYPCSKRSLQLDARRMLRRHNVTTGIRIHPRKPVLIIRSFPC